jgi:hypothetical protein
MTLCAGTFQVTKDFLPLIRLSEPLLKYRTKKETRETLIHEMIHAYNYICRHDLSDDRSGHGKKFVEKMDEINKNSGFKITVYHTFHDEVEHYRQHIWKCDGICVNKKPYFGLVKRAVNRPPSKADFWWENHNKACGGNFYKISQPEKFKKEKISKKKRLNKKKNDNDNNNNSNSNILRNKSNNNSIEKYLKYPKKKIHNKIDEEYENEISQEFISDEENKVLIKNEKLKESKKSKK